jgi:hypothetical protein
MEKVVVNKTGVSLLGTGPSADSTVITWRGQWSKTSPYEFPLFVQGQASDFVASHITFQVCTMLLCMLLLSCIILKPYINTCMRNLLVLQCVPLLSSYISTYSLHTCACMQNTWGKSHQAVAARVDGDKAAFYDCRFVSYQDTLFDVAGRHYYHACYIEGATDFIFGNGKVFFEVCIYIPTSINLRYFLPLFCALVGHLGEGPGQNIQYYQTSDIICLCLCAVCRPRAATCTPPQTARERSRRRGGKRCPTTPASAL